LEACAESETKLTGGCYCKSDHSNDNGSECVTDKYCPSGNYGCRDLSSCTSLDSWNDKDSSASVDCFCGDQTVTVDQQKDGFYCDKEYDDGNGQVLQACADDSYGTPLTAACFCASDLKTNEGTVCNADSVCPQGDDGCTEVCTEGDAKLTDSCYCVSDHNTTEGNVCNADQVCPTGDKGCADTLSNASILLSSLLLLL